MREDRKEFITQMKKRLLLYSKKAVLFVDSLPRDLSSQILARQLLRFTVYLLPYVVKH